MLAADIFSQFGSEQQEEQGIRFRDSFLSLAGGVPMKDIFAAFANRGPRAESLFKVRGS